MVKKGEMTVVITGLTGSLDIKVCKLKTHDGTTDCDYESTNGKTCVKITVQPFAELYYNQACA